MSIETVLEVDPLKLRLEEVSRAVSQLCENLGDDLDGDEKKVVMVLKTPFAGIGAKRDPVEVSPDLADGSHNQKPENGAEYPRKLLEETDVGRFSRWHHAEFEAELEGGDESGACREDGCAHEFSTWGRSTNAASARAELEAARRHVKRVLAERQELWDEERARLERDWAFAMARKAEVEDSLEKAQAEKASLQKALLEAKADAVAHKVAVEVAASAQEHAEREASLAAANASRKADEAEASAVAEAVKRAVAEVGSLEMELMRRDEQLRVLTDRATTTEAELASSRRAEGSLQARVDALSASLSDSKAQVVATAEQRGAAEGAKEAAEKVWGEERIALSQRLQEAWSANAAQEERHGAEVAKIISENEARAAAAKSEASIEVEAIRAELAAAMVKHEASVKEALCACKRNVTAEVTASLNETHAKAISMAISESKAQCEENFREAIRAAEAKTHQAIKASEDVAAEKEAFEAAATAAAALAKADHDSKLSEAKAQESVLKDEIGRIEAVVAELQLEVITSVENAVDEAKHDLCAATEKLEALQQDLEASDKQSAEWRRKLEASCLQSEKWEQDLQASLKESAKLQQDLEASDKQSAKWRRKLEASCLQSEKWEQDLQASLKESAQLQQDLEASEQLSQKRSKDLEDSEKRSSQWKQDLNALEGQAIQWKQDMEALTETLSEKGNKDLEASEKELAITRQELEDSKEKRASLQQDLMRSAQRQQELEMELTATRSHASAEVERADSACASVESLRKQVVESEAFAKSLKDELSMASKSEAQPMLVAHEQRSTAENSTGVEVVLGSTASFVTHQCPQEACVQPALNPEGHLHPETKEPGGETPALSVAVNPNQPGLETIDENGNAHTNGKVPMDAMILLQEANARASKAEGDARNYAARVVTLEKELAEALAREECSLEAEAFMRQSLLDARASEQGLARDLTEATDRAQDQARAAEALRRVVGAMTTPSPGDGAVGTAEHDNRGGEVQAAAQAGALLLRELREQVAAAHAHRVKSEERWDAVLMEQREEISKEAATQAEGLRVSLEGRVMLHRSLFDELRAEVRALEAQLGSFGCEPNQRPEQLGRTSVLPEQKEEHELSAEEREEFLAWRRRAIVTEGSEELQNKVLALEETVARLRSQLEVGVCAVRTSGCGEEISKDAATEADPLVRSMLPAREPEDLGVDHGFDEADSHKSPSTWLMHRLQRTPFSSINGKVGDNDENVPFSIEAREVGAEPGRKPSNLGFALSSVAFEFSPEQAPAPTDATKLTARDDAVEGIAFFAAKCRELEAVVQVHEAAQADVESERCRLAERHAQLDSLVRDVSAAAGASTKRSQSHSISSSMASELDALRLLREGIAADVRNGESSANGPYAKAIEEARKLRKKLSEVKEKKAAYKAIARTHEEENRRLKHAMRQNQHQHQQQAVEFQAKREPGVA